VKRGKRKRKGRKQGEVEEGWSRKRREKGTKEDAMQMTGAKELIDGSIREERKEPTWKGRSGIEEGRVQSERNRSEKS
jgi:hypothetical protein